MSMNENDQLDFSFLNRSFKLSVDTNPMHLDLCRVIMINENYQVIFWFTICKLYFTIIGLEEHNTFKIRWSCFDQWVFK